MWNDDIDFPSVEAAEAEWPGPLPDHIEEFNQWWFERTYSPEDWFSWAILVDAAGNAA